MSSVEVCVPGFEFGGVGVNYLETPHWGSAGKFQEGVGRGTQDMEGGRCRGEGCDCEGVRKEEGMVASRSSCVDEEKHPQGNCCEFCMDK